MARDKELARKAPASVDRTELAQLDRDRTGIPSLAAGKSAGKGAGTHHLLTRGPPDRAAKRRSGIETMVKAAQVYALLMPIFAAGDRP